jgi:hypothetical protein
MDFTDFGVTIILALVVYVLAQLIPLTFIGVGGVLCLKKGYKPSGILFLTSIVPLLINHVGGWLIARIAKPTGVLGIVPVMYFDPACGFFGDLLVALGVVTLIRAVSARSK